MRHIAIICLLLLLLGTAHSASPSYAVVVKKSERKLYLYRDGKLAKTYRIALGLVPVGQKTHQGDYRTPEGDYLIVRKNARSQFYLSLGLDYPNAADAARGLKAGIITRAQYNAIMAAHARHALPPQNTRLGGDVFIHGRGTASDWTWGCVAMENDDIQELFDLLPIGTPVRIEP